MAETGVVSLDEVAWLRDNSPARRLLRADHAPPVLSFLHQVLVTENVRSIPAAKLASRPEPRPVVAPSIALDPGEAELDRDLLDGAFGPSVRLEQERTSFAAIEQALASRDLPC